MRSLRQRAILGGLVWAAIYVAIGGFALFYFFDTETRKRFDGLLFERHLQVVVALNNSNADADLMASYINDAAYQRPYSGRYWQAVGADETVLASRSMFDALFPTLADVSPEIKFWAGDGPGGQVRGIQQQVNLEDGSLWVVTVAESLTAFQEERKRIRQSLLATFALIGALGIAGSILQTRVVVRPLAKLREDVAHRWDNAEALDATEYPEEVLPLVSDINTLLDRNREIVERGRRQAADMAHALKTPSAILRNELDALKKESVDVRQATDALDRVDAQLVRSLARIRAGNSSATLHAQTKIENSVNRMARLFRSMPEFSSKTLLVEMSVDLNVPMDVQDLEEVLGNVLENAFQWSREVVKISCSKSGQEILISVEDDGPGISEADRETALRSGGRLDTSAPGTGLGLAIVSDLLQAYGGSVSLGRSDELGGLRVAILLSTKRDLGPQT